LLDRYHWEFRPYRHHFISSKVPDELEETEVLISNESEEFSNTGLLVSSVFKLQRLVTVPKALIQRRLGFVGDNLEKEIAKKLKSMFHLE
jgi:mRNA interferase MazF